MDADPGQGDLELISSRRNPLVGRLRALHQGRGRREQQRLLLEGTHLLQEVLREACKNFIVPPALLPPPPKSPGQAPSPIHSLQVTTIKYGASSAGQLPCRSQLLPGT